VHMVKTREHMYNRPVGADGRDLHVVMENIDKAYRSTMCGNMFDMGDLLSVGVSNKAARTQMSAVADKIEEKTRTKWNAWSIFKFSVENYAAKLYFPNKMNKWLEKFNSMKQCTCMCMQKGSKWKPTSEATCKPVNPNNWWNAVAGQLKVKHVYYLKDGMNKYSNIGDATLTLRTSHDSGCSTYLQVQPGQGDSFGAYVATCKAPKHLEKVSAPWADMKIVLYDVPQDAKMQPFQ